MPGELVFTVRSGVGARPRGRSASRMRDSESGPTLQEWVRENPEILGDGVYIVTFEFDAWRASRRGREADRLDLLGTGRSTDGYLVLAELKRGLAPDTVDMQAVKYAAFASRFTVQTLAQRPRRAYLTQGQRRRVDRLKTRRCDRLEAHAGGELDPDSAASSRGLFWWRRAFPHRSLPAPSGSPRWAWMSHWSSSRPTARRTRPRASHRLADLAARRCRGLHRRASRVRAEIRESDRARTDAPPAARTVATLVEARSDRATATQSWNLLVESRILPCSGVSQVAAWVS